MQLLYVSTFQFLQRDDGTYGFPSCSDSFFQKCLDVFDEVRVLGQTMKAYIDVNALIKICDPSISVGAKIIGKITIGDNCEIGANAVVVHDVPPNTLVVTQSIREIPRTEKEI